MQSETQNDGEISLSDIFRAIWSKIWIVLVSLIAGIAIGGMFGYVKYHNVHYYGAQVNYFVSSDPKNSEQWSGGIGNTYNENVLKQIQELLASDNFSRILMAGLPEAEGIEQNTEAEEKFFKALSKNVSYSYEVGSNKIMVKVSVLNNPERAARLLDSVKAELPGFISEKMANIGKTICEQLNYRQSGLLNPGQTRTEMMKFGLILGFLAAVVACVVLVVTDRTDTRLRNYEDLPHKFNLPVLGVIPRIEPPVAENEKERKTEATK